MLTLALPKGRLADESIELLIAKGWMESRPDPKSRELTFMDPAGKIKAMLVKSMDVPVYVEECAADAGIAGWDVVHEGDYDILVPADLGIGYCRLSVAGVDGFDLNRHKGRKIRVATKYPELAKKYFFSRGISCEIIKLYGSIELAPLCNLSDCIVDLVSTGNTLKSNGLKEVEVIMESSARLIVNKASFYKKQEEISALISEFLV